MPQPPRPGRVANINLTLGNNTQQPPDPSSQNIYAIAQGNKIATPVEENNKITIDREVVNLLEWLARQQGVSPEVALKKAVALAAYIEDVTTNRGSKILVQRPDNSLGELILK